MAPGPSNCAIPNPKYTMFPVMNAEKIFPSRMAGCVVDGARSWTVDATRRLRRALFSFVDVFAVGFVHDSRGPRGIRSR